MRGKPNVTISSVLRNTSCSHGWLRVFVQTIFAIIIVTSFILIVYMVVQNSWGTKPARPKYNPRCLVTNCRVTCNNTPFNGEYDADIIQAVTEADPLCKKLSVTLTNPIFVDGAIPVNWFAGWRAHIYELVIAGGNLMSVPPEAFMSPSARNIHTLVFYNITINSWVADSLVGLASLSQLFIVDSNIISISSGGLRAVDDTLELLTISGSQNWYPANITGSSKMPRVTTVDFSGNIFYDVLDKNSFIGIEKCKMLYLNSCRITAIGAGTFDNLLYIEVLFLNNNFLVTIPPGLFKNIVIFNNPRPRINLQDNLWYCDCGSNDIKQLIAKDVLLLDPICICPSQFHGKIFSEFLKHCDNNTSTSITDVSHASSTLAENDADFIEVNGGCYNNNTTLSLNSYLSTISPVHKHRCGSQITNQNDLYDIVRRNSENPEQAENDWIKFSFFLKTERYSMVQVAASGTKLEGLLWYESACPNEIYCIDMVPNFLRMYNVDLSANYVFCPVSLSSRSVVSTKCVVYNLSTDNELKVYTKFMIIIYVSTIFVCLIFGAIFVYALVRRNPNLLKGSKRILFVKHKTIDALVLPPKIPLRNINDVNNSPQNVKDDKIFIIPGKNVVISKFNSLNSIRSNKSITSITPSYISAIHPTEDQLAEWNKHYLNNDISITTVRSELSTYSWVRSSDPSYYSLDCTNDLTYEHL